MPETTTLLSQKWDLIFFTGSPAVGKIVHRAAAQHLTPCVLELDGKNPTIVHASADLQSAARRIAYGRFLNSGHICTAPDHVLVARTLLALAAAAATLAAPSAAFAQAAPSNPAPAALAALERQADALFAAAAKRDWTGAKIALDGAKGAVDVLRTQRFEGVYADAGGRMEALYAARPRLDAAVAEADIALGATDVPAAMRSANHLTEIVWQLGTPIDPPLVNQAQRLAFLARKLEYGRGVGDKVLYAETVAEIRQFWSGFRPALAARKPPPDLAATDAAIARLGNSGREDAEAVRRLEAAAQSLRTTLGG